MSNNVEESTGFTDDFNSVFKAEVADLRKRREAMEVDGAIKDTPDADNNLVGLALSGGGIRSATFNLGLIQALFRMRVLHCVDYLSTVSGGGYIGSCLTTLLNSMPVGHSPKELWGDEHFPLGREVIKNESVEASCGPKREEAVSQNVQERSDECEPPREKNQPRQEMYGKEKPPVRHLRYNSNYLTADANGFIGTLRPFMVFFTGAAQNLLLLLPYLALTTLILSSYFLIAPEKPVSLRSDWPYLKRAPDFSKTSAIKTFDETLQVYGMAAKTLETEVYAVTDSSSLSFATYEERIKTARSLAPARIAALEDSVKRLDNGVKERWWATFHTPMLLFALVTLVSLFFGGLFRGAFGSRYLIVRWLTAGFLASTVILALHLYGVAIVYWRDWDFSTSIGFAPLWGLILTKLVPVLFGSSLTGKNSFGTKLVPVLVGLLVPLFILWLMGHAIAWLVLTSPSESTFIPTQGWTGILFLTAATGILFLVSLLINLNVVSPHSFYRDQLSHAYLIGHASEAFAPFGKVRYTDDLKLSSLRSERGPYHIINTTLSLTTSLPDPKSKTEGVFRTGESFILSKGYCGSRETGYRLTSDYEEHDSHLNLGTAMAVSAAAANIGMAQNNMWWLRLLMGLLNIRLGYWVRHPKKVGEGIFPPNSIQAMRELLGAYGKNNAYVNLSDGGHFDNIGVYELLKRRVKFIIVGDAETDGELTFQAMSNVIRLARIDLGIDIDINLGDVKKVPATGLSRNHCAVGIITYPQGGAGYLLYCKASVSGDETTHLKEYLSNHSDFPHQSTGDQFFDEQQFEAYRELGYHIGKTAFGPAANQNDKIGVCALEEAFVAMKQFWYPHSPVVDTHFTRHAEAFNQIVTELKNDPDLKFLDQQFYPEWQHLDRVAILTKPPPAAPLNNWLPATEIELRKGFYLCTQMIQLMENVFLDLDLEVEFDHPDNRGWMNLFRHWSWSGMFRVTWAISTSLFGARFQGFCKQKLDLKLGRVFVDPLAATEDAEIERRLNDHERLLIKEQHFDQGCYDHVHIFRLLVCEPLGSGQRIEFPFGFALTRNKGIVYFRIQDHLRKMGLGRQALEQLKRAGIGSLASVPVEQYPVGTDLEGFKRMWDSTA